MIQRVLKTVAALGAGHLIQALVQFLSPAAFLHAYGVTRYGEWLVLSSAVGYLTTLDFGIQTYLINELTTLYHRGEVNRFSLLLSTGLRVLLILLGMGLALSVGVLWLPVGNWLHLTVEPQVVQWTMLGLAIQVLGGILLGSLLGIFRVMGKAHQGVLWGNAQKLCMLVVTLLLLGLGRSFHEVAWGQAFSLLIFIPLAWFHWRKIAPELTPSVNRWSREEAFRMIRPSGCFGLITLNQFLIYQLPLMILNARVGAAAVVVFSLARVLFSFVRQLSSMIQASIAPEITRLYGLGDLKNLSRVYRLCETLLLPSALLANLGVLCLSPWLLKIWVSKPEVFDPILFAGVMVISMTLTAKEYKLHFQYATNRHMKSALVTCISYLLLIATLPWAADAGGVLGFLLLWWMVELFQVGFLHFQNTQLMASSESPLSLRPLVTTHLLMGVSLMGLWFGKAWTVSGELPVKIAVCLALIVSIAALSARLFNFAEVLQWCSHRMTRLPLHRRRV